MLVRELVTRLGFHSDGAMDKMKRADMAIANLRRGFRFIVAGAAAAAGALATLGYGAVRNADQIAITNSIHVSVPPGTPAEQAKSISKQVRREVQSELQRNLRETLGDMPAYAAP